MAEFCGELSGANRCRYGLRSLSCLIVLLMACHVHALPAYLDAVKTTYAFKPGGTLDSRGCNVCHAGATNRNSLNFYGKDLQAAFNASQASTISPALLHSIDSHDSDGDGWTNGDELKADTLPGDPASKPNGPPPGSLKPKSFARAGEESNPFSLAALLYPSHAQHPAIVHFPIALFVFSVFLDMFGLISGNRAFNNAASLNLAAAAVTGVLSVITGLLAWRFAFGGEPLAGDRWLLFHLILGVVTTVLMCLLWVIRARQSTTSVRPLSRLYVIASLITLAVISLTGHLGGIVSGIVR